MVHVLHQLHLVADDEYQGTGLVDVDRMDFYSCQRNRSTGQSFDPNEIPKSRFGLQIESKRIMNG